MASGTVTQGPPSEARRAAHDRELVEYEKYIDQQLTKTARQVQGMDIATGLMCWLAGALLYLLVAAAFDHWFLTGGLGTWGRWVALAGLILASGWYLARRVLPPLLNRINPVYSAHTIERGRPQLKNSLVNFLLLRREPRELNEAIRDALQSQAATGLAAAPVEHAIDRSPLVRFALVLLGAVLVAALYIMLSPKDPLRSAARVMLPWASIERPTRFTLADIQAEVVETGRKFTGGPAEVFYGQRVKISATVMNRGRIAAEPVVLRFTTADGSASDQPLTLEARERNADIVLPAGTLAAAVGGGLQQSLDYTLTAGDAVAGPFRITVLAAPSIEVESLEYVFPDYTKLADQKLADRGDIRALEGTTVIVRARANQEIAQAWLDLDCDGRPNDKMQPKGREAGANFKLALKDDRRTPVNSSYLLRFKNQDGFENPQPIRYRIDVIPDLAPEIAWESPREIDEPRELPIDEPLEVMFSAKDKDFELASVVLRAEVETDAKADKRPWEKALLTKPQAEKWTSAPASFVPAEHGFQAGQTVLVWGEASDNRQPKPNVAETPKLKITLLPPRDPAEKRGPNHQPNDGRQQQQPDDAQQQPQEREQPGENQEGQRGQEPGDQQPEKPEDQQNGEAQEGQQAGAGERGKQGEPKPGENAEPQAGEEQQPGPGQQKPGEQGASSSDEPSGGGESSEADQEGQSGKAGSQAKEGQSGESTAESAGQEGASGRDGAPHGKPSDQEGQEGDGSESGEAGRGQQGAKKPSRRVDPDAQEGDAFERMQDYFDEQDKQNQQGAKNGSPDAEQQPGEEGGEQAGERKAARQDKSSTNEGGDSGKEQGAAGNEAQPDQGAGETKQPREGGEPANGEKTQPKGNQTEQPTPQEGGERGEEGENGEQQRAGEDQPQSAEPSKDPGAQQQPGNNQPAADNQRAGGAGEQGQKEPKGTPEAQGKNKQRDKTGKQQEQQPGNGESEPQSPSTSDHQSDSQGGQSGDQSGGGKEGGGQNAEQDGTGSAGSNTEADDGSGTADQSGEGQTDGRGGDDRQASDATGDKNANQSKGSGRQGDRQDPANDTQAEGGESGRQAAGEHAPRQNGEQQPNDRDAQPDGGKGQSAPNGAQQSGRSQAGDSAPNGGQGGEESDTPPPPQPPTELGSDPANKEYANRATELVLNRLKDQLKKGEPDEALLEKLQWTKQDLERFVKRWEEMKANAKQPGAQGQKAKQELDEALKSLGLRPRGTSTKAGKSRQDQTKGIRDTRRSEPPAEYAEQYQQYNVGTSKGK